MFNVRMISVSAMAVVAPAAVHEPQGSSEAQTFYIGMERCPYLRFAN
jgi:hypothetical protein